MAYTDSAAAVRIQVAVERLAAIKLPTLARPPVPLEAPATSELVSWAAELYCFGLLSHFREMLRSFLFLVENGYVPASFLIARSLFEIGAHAYYVHKHVTQYLDAGDIEKAWVFLAEINMGSRYMQEEYGEVKDMPPFSAPREIGKVIRCYDEWLGHSGQASTEYSFLSEFAHPNMAAFSHYYTINPGKLGFAEVAFRDAKREPERMPFSHVSIAVLSSLHFTVKLLEHIGETEVAPQVKAVLEALPR